MKKKIAKRKVKIVYRVCGEHWEGEHLFWAGWVITWRRRLFVCLFVYLLAYLLIYIYFPLLNDLFIDVYIYLGDYLFGFCCCLRSPNDLFTFLPVMTYIFTCLHICSFLFDNVFTGYLYIFVYLLVF